MRIVFMGTPDFSVPILAAIATKNEIALVVTQPDKIVGRKREIQFSPVKKYAIEHNMPLFQPIKVRTDYQEIIHAQPDIIITAAYGQIVPQKVLDCPPLHCINVHASLLPKYRGGAPIHRAIMAGEKETGVTIMYMAAKMDEGDIILQERMPILDSDDVGSLFDKLSELGAKMIIEVLPKIGVIESIPQDNGQATYASNISHADEKINWHSDCRKIFNHIRGLNPWPVAYTSFHELAIKVFSCSYNLGEQKGALGEIVVLNKTLGIQAQDGVVYLQEIQVSGKKRVKITEFLNGQRILSLGDCFDEN